MHQAVAVRHSDEGRLHRRQVTWVEYGIPGHKGHSLYSQRNRLIRRPGSTSVRTVAAVDAHRPVAVEG